MIEIQQGSFVIPSSHTNEDIVMQLYTKLEGFVVVVVVEGCRSACSSQCNQKTDLMEETRQYIYKSTLPLTRGSLRPKRGPKVGCNLIALAGS